MKTSMKLFALTAAALIALTGCGGNNGGNNGNTGNNAGNASEGQNNHENHQAENNANNNGNNNNGLSANAMRDSSLIPSENGQKTYTTNNLGQTTYGMGTSVYSMIGSSGLHSNGFSAHLESRLSGAGIEDVRVFVFDDTVVLATAKRDASASSSDELQRRLLDPQEGMSARGVTPRLGIGGVTGNSSNTDHDNLTMAASQIKTLMGAEVKVLTVEGAEAVQAIEKIRAGALADNMSPDQIARDIGNLLRLVKNGQQ
ncbi:hypothetical protein D3P08_24225 [Paenibacillus nanensis]|uniref:Sporulation protein n=1 Tax=Paenibacillus nanensis TaxID=393251 RepID=A0A3A1ULB8_9BACL|nr:hypothetical protein [Paenibacillus nanensis]RIX48614.1 hypothetical protein D3P08_24225 [Paenibacillus nanensis]